MDKLFGNDLAIVATKARLLAVDAVHTASSGHPGGSLSCMDALVSLYFNEMNLDPARPDWADRVRSLQGPLRPGAVRGPGSARLF